LLAVPDAALHVAVYEPEAKPAQVYWALFPDQLVQSHWADAPFANASMQSNDVFLAGQDIVKPVFCAGLDGDTIGMPSRVLTPDRAVVVNIDVVDFVVEVLGTVVVGVVVNEVVGTVDSVVRAVVTKVVELPSSSIVEVTVELTVDVTVDDDGMVVDGKLVVEVDLGGTFMKLTVVFFEKLDALAVRVTNPVVVLERYATTVPVALVMVFAETIFA
jgi:hypothetical protein